jgi:hypothetical protein
MHYWPKGLSVESTQGGACDDSGDQLSLVSPVLTDKEKAAVARELKDAGWSGSVEDGFHIATGQGELAALFDTSDGSLFVSRG